VAVSVADDDQWSAHAHLLGGRAGDACFATLDVRVARHDELDELIGAWTATRTAAGAAAQLQAAGVAAYEVLDHMGVLHDAQVRDRRWFQFVASSRFPDGDAFSGHPIRLLDTPGQWWRSGPTMGEDTVELLTERAGLSRDDVDALLASGAAFTAGSPEQTCRRPYIDYAEILGMQRTDR
jgi:crotonobetainyl-CoA:carnitine CoA-transferase CaiB-like acyl-CoA transferase